MDFTHHITQQEGCNRHTAQSDVTSDLQEAGGDGQRQRTCVSLTAEGRLLTFEGRLKERYWRVLTAHSLGHLILNTLYSLRVALSSQLSQVHLNPESFCSTVKH